MLRRRSVGLAPGEARALRSTIDAVDRGKDALLSAVPGRRTPGRAAAEALLDFESALADAGSAMPGWRVRATEAVWRSCADALDESARMAESLRLDAPALDFEGLVLVFTELIAPLEAFGDAARLLPRRAP